MLTLRLTIAALLVLILTSPTTAAERAWHVQWEAQTWNDNQIFDLHLLEREGTIVAAFMRGTGFRPPSIADASRLSGLNIESGSLTGTIKLAGRADEHDRIMHEIKKSGREWKRKGSPSITLELGLNHQDGKVNGTIAYSHRNKQRQATAQGRVRTVAPLDQGSVELCLEGMNAGITKSNVGTLVRMAVQNGQVQQVTAITKGTPHNPAVQQWTATIDPHSIIEGSAFKAVIRPEVDEDVKQNKKSRRWSWQGMLALDGQIIGDWIGGEARWQGDDKALTTSFIGRISRARQPMQMSYPVRQWEPTPTTAVKDPELVQQASEEALKPIRSEEGKLGWQNRLLARAGRKNKWRGFIHAPHLVFSPVVGAERYRFDLKAGKSGAGSWTFEASHPCTNLAALWHQLPIGTDLTLSCNGLDGAGEVIGPALTPEQRFGEFNVDNEGSPHPKIVRPARALVFQRKTFFQGPYGPSRTPAELRQVALHMARHQIGIARYFALRGLSNNGVHDCTLGCVNGGESGSNLIIAGFIQACCLLARLTDDPVESAEALVLAERVAAVMAAQNKNRLPHTYHGFIGNAFWVGWAWLDLYAATGDERWQAAATNLARQLAAAQQPEGGWMGVKKVGKEWRTDLWIGGTFGPSEFRETTPSSNLHFLGRLRSELASTEFAAAESRAYEGVMKTSVPTMTWQNFGWHSGEVTAPQCMVAPHALTYVFWLLDLAPTEQRDLTLAADIVRWCEDRHVSWSRSEDPLIVRPSCWGWSRAAGNGNMIQARLAYACARLGQETGDSLWLAKARALAHGIIEATDPDTGTNNADFRRTTGKGCWRFTRMDYSETAAMLAATADVLAEVDQ